MPTIILGIVVDMKKISTKDKLDRKKYIGVWRCESKMMTRMMSRFPSIVTRYMAKNNPKRRSCSSGSSESPMRWNSKTPVRFSISSLTTTLFKKKIYLNNETSKRAPKTHIFLMQILRNKSLPLEVHKPTNTSQF